MIIKKLFYIIAVLIQFTSCAKDVFQPLGPPEIILDNATDVTFDSASLTGMITANNNETSSYYLILSKEPTCKIIFKRINVIPSAGTFKISLTSLTPQTTYYCTLTAYSGYSSVSSPIKQFTTSKYTAPSFTNTALVCNENKQVRFELFFNQGTLDPDTMILRYKSLNSKDTIMQSIPKTISGTRYSIPLTDLQPDSTYIFSVLCRNRKGEYGCVQLNVNTNDYLHINGYFIIQSNPGDIDKLIPSDEKYKITSLKVNGPFNSTDLIFIRAMGGIGNDKQKNVYTDGRLEMLDLSDANTERGGDTAYYNGSEQDKINNTGDIPAFFMRGTTSIKKIVIPNIMNGVGYGAFSDCNLEDIETGENSNQYSIDGILYNFGYLEVFPPKKSCDIYRIPEKIDYINRYAFKDVCKVKEIILHERISGLGERAFYGHKCMETSSGKLTIPYNVTMLQQYAFENSGFKRIDINAYIYKLNKGLFYDCANLEYVKIGGFISDIDENVFSNCPKLKEIHCVPFNPPTISNISGTQFNATDKKTCTIYVPKGSLSLYKAATIWKEFSNIVEE